MDQEKKYDAELIKYVLEESTADERQQVEEWLSASEDNRVYFQELLNCIALIKLQGASEEFDVQKEWKVFQRLAENNSLKNKYVESSNSEPADVVSIDEIENRKKRKLYQILIGGAVAASIILAVLAGIGLFDGKQVDNKTISNTVVSDSSHYTALNKIEIFEVNSTSETRSFSLPDGSQISLYPKSELTYREPSNENARRVILTGKADFVVAKDKNRPFSVFSGQIYTTALGTRFTVVAPRDQFKIFVRLHEGKVVVKPDTAVNKFSMRDVYLIPGQELMYNIRNGKSLVRSFDKLETKRNDEEKISADDPAAGAYSKRSWYRFNNQSLSQIFQTLEGMYGVKIIFSKAELNKMYFIGTFEKADSLEVILNQIAFINNLEVRKENNDYIITKKK